MDSKNDNKDLRKACVEAVFDEFAEHGDMIRPQYAGQWNEIELADSWATSPDRWTSTCPASVDVIIDAIVKEAQK